MNLVASQIDVEDLVGTSPNRQLDVRVYGTAHLFDSLAQGQPLHLLAIDMGDQVAGLQTGAEGRRVVDRRYDLHVAVLHRHLDAEPADLALRLDLHLAEVLLVQIADRKSVGSGKRG